MILDLYENDSKTIRVYKEEYRKTHPLAGKVNPVYQCRIKVKRGLPANRQSTGHTDKRLAIRYAEDKLNQIIALDAQGLSTSSMRFSIVCERYHKSLINDNRVNPNRVSDEKLAQHELVMRLHFQDLMNKPIATIQAKTLNDLFVMIENKPKESYSMRPDREKQKKVVIYSGRRSASGMNKMKQVMRAIFKYARDVLNIIKDIPAIKPSTDTLNYKPTLSRLDWGRILKYLEQEFVKEYLKWRTDELVLRRTADEQKKV